MFKTTLIAAAAVAASVSAASADSYISNFVVEQDRDSLIESITNARFGVMPAWGQRLSDAEVKAVTLYVHQLGGGE